MCSHGNGSHMDLSNVCVEQHGVTLPRHDGGFPLTDHDGVFLSA